MKIRLKYTDELIEVNGEYFDEGKFVGFLAGDPAAPGGEVIYPKEDVAEDPDWDAYRMEAAKDILCAMVGPTMYDLNAGAVAMVGAAIALADTLIEKLKEK